HRAHVRGGLTVQTSATATGLFEKEAKRLRVITTSEVRTFRRCPREHHFTYRLLVRARRTAEPLRFGTLIHHGLEKWFHTVSLDAAREAMWSMKTKDTDAYELAKADAMITGYHHRWKDADLEVLAVEAPFECELINPLTGAPSKTYRLGGKIDAVVRLPDGRVAVVEHKSSAEDVSGGSVYWQKLRIDAQVSNYLAGARSIGFDATECIYDVARKPTAVPRLATPEEKREYTKPRTKLCPECKKKNAPPAPHTITTDAGDVQCVDSIVLTFRGGELYANQRATDETPDEYRARILKEQIGPEPEKYFIRGDVVRLKNEREEAAYDLWSTARAMREAELAQRWPRNPDACFRYGRPCTFFAVCSGAASLDDPTLFRIAESAHEELAEEKAA
ncbi:MAG: nuclease superfamily protein, partial [Myxococcaceae bacterium]|nr:nuclease superfamily protein [Myxococcaceae bacterium]